MGRRRTRHTVTVSCAQCGINRNVRPALVKGFQALACASHHATAENLGLEAPEGHVVTLTRNVAAFFDGFALTKHTPATQRAHYRASAVAAAGSGRPPPEPNFNPRRHVLGRSKSDECIDQATRTRWMGDS
jgi:hypothetical protein